MMTFDRSLSSFVNVLDQVFGENVVTGGAFLRDANGRLLFLSDSIPTGPALLDLRQRVRQLAPYVNSDLPMMTPIDLGEPDAISAGRPFYISAEGTSRLVHLIDRRIIGQDWSASPTRSWRPPQAARLVFWSLKGGVGRSTALAVVASHFARTGKNVLAVDLDLEAPGIGSILLRPSDRPEFGALDWFVETGIGNIDDHFIESLVAPSSLAENQGVLHVVPALGRSSEINPENVIGKLGRAYLEDILPDGTARSFMAQTQALITALESRYSYDSILIDARAGLNETTAAAILGLGADVLLFAENTPQTFDGYRYVLAHLHGLPNNGADDWRLRLKMVHAKAATEDRAIFRDHAHKLFERFVYEEERGIDDGFNFDLDDPDAPHAPWTVYDDGQYRGFNPLAKQSQLDPRLYEATFGDLIAGVNARATVDAPE